MQAWITQQCVVQLTNQIDASISLSCCSDILQKCYITGNPASHCSTCGVPSITSMSDSNSHRHMCCWIKKRTFALVLMHAHSGQAVRASSKASLEVACCCTRPRCAPESLAYSDTFNVKLLKGTRISSILQSFEEEQLRTHSCWRAAASPSLTAHESSHEEASVLSVDQAAKLVVAVHVCNSTEDMYLKMLQWTLQRLNSAQSRKIQLQELQHATI